VWERGSGGEGPHSAGYEDFDGTLESEELERRVHGKNHVAMHLPDRHLPTGHAAGRGALRPTLRRHRRARGARPTTDELLAPRTLPIQSSTFNREGSAILSLMIERLLQPRLLDLATRYPVLTLTGPRQSGKTTLSRMAFPDLPYVSLENPGQRAFAEEDPVAFLARYRDGAVIDEVQRVPQIFSYLQGMVDEDPRPGRFLLTGSQNLAHFFPGQLPPARRDDRQVGELLRRLAGERHRQRPRIVRLRAQRRRDGEVKPLAGRHGQ